MDTQTCNLRFIDVLRVPTISFGLKWAEIIKNKLKISLNLIENMPQEIT